MLDADAIAFPVLTTEDEQADGNVRARMNVIHEAGLFQGRLGFAQDDELWWAEILGRAFGSLGLGRFWLAQCLCEPDESLPYRKLVESSKAEEQCIRIRASQSESIDGENLNTLGRRQFFRLP